MCWIVFLYTNSLNDVNDRTIGTIKKEKWLFFHRSYRSIVSIVGVAYKKNRSLVLLKIYKILTESAHHTQLAKLLKKGFLKMNISNYLLQKEDYTWKNALLWGNCTKHFNKSLEGRLGYWVVHVVIGIGEFFPIIGQIVSIVEKIFAETFYKNFCSESEESTSSNEPGNGNVDINMVNPDEVHVGDLCSHTVVCQHQIHIGLKDGRRAGVFLDGRKICSIMKDLRQLGTEHEKWTHFFRYQNDGIPSSHEVLTELFNAPHCLYSPNPDINNQIRI